MYCWTAAECKHCTVQKLELESKSIRIAHSLQRLKIVMMLRWCILVKEFLAPNGKRVKLWWRGKMLYLPLGSHFSMGALKLMQEDGSEVFIRKLSLRLWILVLYDLLFIYLFIYLLIYLKQSVLLEAKTCAWPSWFIVQHHGRVAHNLFGAFWLL